jgi:hypothetical protein
MTLILSTIVPAFSGSIAGRFFLEMIGTGTVNNTALKHGNISKEKRRKMHFLFVLFMTNCQD